VSQSFMLVSQPVNSPLSQVQLPWHQSEPEFQPCHPCCTTCPPVKVHVNFIVDLRTGVKWVVVVVVVVAVVVTFSVVEPQAPHVRGHIDVT